MFDPLGECWPLGQKTDVFEDLVWPLRTKPEEFQQSMGQKHWFWRYLASRRRVLPRLAAGAPRPIGLRLGAEPPFHAGGEREVVERFDPVRAKGQVV
jgi:hypothetical protein